MLIARLLAPEPGELIGDACAAPGTKATHLAELMDNRGKIVAIDPQAARLRLVGGAAARLGIGIIEPHTGTVSTIAPRFRGRCDRVLVDAPCSNLGVLRRNPDVKWRRTADDLGRLRDKQRGILTAAAAMVKPGGRLVYATCSLEPEENEDVVTALLESLGRLAGGHTRRISRSLPTATASSGACPTCTARTASRPSASAAQEPEKRPTASGRRPRRAPRRRRQSRGCRFSQLSILTADAPPPARRGPRNVPLLACGLALRLSRGPSSSRAPKAARVCPRPTTPPDAPPRDRDR